MKLLYLAIALLILALQAIGQEPISCPRVDCRDLEHRILDGKTKVHINADDGDWEMIAEELEGKTGIVVVDEPDDAEFLILYLRTSLPPEGGQSSGHMEAYLKDPKDVISVWSKSSKELKVKDNVLFPRELARIFLREMRPPQK